MMMWGYLLSGSSFDATHDAVCIDSLVSPEGNGVFRKLAYDLEKCWMPTPLICAELDFGCDVQKYSEEL